MWQNDKIESALNRVDIPAFRAEFFSFQAGMRHSSMNSHRHIKTRSYASFSLLDFVPLDKCPAPLFVFFTCINHPCLWRRSTSTDLRTLLDSPFSTSRISSGDALVVINWMGFLSGKTKRSLIWGHISPGSFYVNMILSTIALMKIVFGNVSMHFEGVEVLLLPLTGIFLHMVIWYWGQLSAPSTQECATAHPRAL